MNPKPRVTQNDVAKAAGVDRATVSLALRDKPNIPKKTRDKIKRVAARLGYTPDPMLSALATYRTTLLPKSFHGTLVWLAKTGPELQWRTIPHFTDYLEGAKARAALHGYQIEVMDIAEMNITWRRAAAIARARGVNGLLLCPQPKSDTRLDDLPWEHFASVTFGYTLSHPSLNSVASAHFRAMMTAVRELQARGYRRIGCALRSEHDLRLDRNFRGAYLAACTLGGQEPLPICPDDAQGSNGEILRRWLSDIKPDAFITGNIYQLEILKQWRVSVPNDVGVACPVLSTAEGSLAGMVERNRLIGEVAVDLLVAMIHRGERGIPDVPQRVLVDAYWHPGKSVRRPSVAVGVK